MLMRIGVMEDAQNDAAVPPHAKEPRGHLDCPPLDEPCWESPVGAKRHDGSEHVERDVEDEFINRHRMHEIFDPSQPQQPEREVDASPLPVAQHTDDVAAPRLSSKRATSKPRHADILQTQLHNATTQISALNARLAELVAFQQQLLERREYLKTRVVAAQAERDAAVATFAELTDELTRDFRQLEDEVMAKQREYEDLLHENTQLKEYLHQGHTS
jgi:uncharacterized membrane-anchored protein YhcB (DUF1043 family)